MKKDSKSQKATRKSKDKSKSKDKTKAKAPRIIEFKVADKGGFVLPFKAKDGSVGYDLVCPADVKIPARSRAIVPLNFAIALPYDVEAKIEARSGFSLKGIEGFGVRRERKKWLGIFPYWKKTHGRQRFDADVLTGKIDPDYKDTVCVIIKNYDDAFVIRTGTRIAQMTFYRVLSPRLVEVAELEGEDRGGGFESTGATI